MSDAHLFLKDLTVVLGVAAVTTVLFQRLHLPVVLGYLLAGLLVGPHVPIRLVVDVATIHTLSELGVVLLMFSLGLEFSLRKLVRLGPRVALVAVVEVGLMLTLGYLAGQLLGWSPLASAFAGAVVAISSTMLVARGLMEARAEHQLREEALIAIGRDMNSSADIETLMHDVVRQATKILRADDCSLFLMDDPTETHPGV